MSKVNTGYFRKRTSPPSGKDHGKFDEKHGRTNSLQTLTGGLLKLIKERRGGSDNKDLFMDEMDSDILLLRELKRISSVMLLEMELDLLYQTLNDV